VGTETDAIKRRMVMLRGEEQRNRVDGGTKHTLVPTVKTTTATTTVTTTAITTTAATVDHGREVGAHLHHTQSSGRMERATRSSDAYPLILY